MGALAHFRAPRLCHWVQPGVSSCEWGSMLRCRLENPDTRSRQLQDAVTNVEKHFGELCQIFAAYVQKTARLRDKVDLLVNEINVYASTETPHLKQGLKNFADNFAKRQDYWQAEVERLEAEVIEPLKAYGTIVKMKWDDLKATLTARNREVKQLTQLERTHQRNPSDRHVIVSFEFWSLKKYSVRYAVKSKYIWKLCIYTLNVQRIWI